LGEGVVQVLARFQTHCCCSRVNILTSCCCCRCCLPCSPSSQSLRWGCPSETGCSSHRVWNLFVGPRALKYSPSLFPWQLWAFLTRFVAHFDMIIKCLEFFCYSWCMRVFEGLLTISVVVHRGSLAPPKSWYMSVSKVGNPCFPCRSTWFVG
jgi:hypothetical protein